MGGAPRPGCRLTGIARIGVGRLDGKVAIVTGGAVGIGRAVVERIVHEGGRVVVGDVDIDGLRTARGTSGRLVRCATMRRHRRTGSRSARDARDRALRSARHRGGERRRWCRVAHRRSHACRLAARHRVDTHRRVPHCSCGGPRHGRPRLHRRHRERQRGAAGEADGGLLRGQGRGGCVGGCRCARARTPRDPGQRGRTRTCADADD